MNQDLAETWFVFASFQTPQSLNNKPMFNPNSNQAAKKQCGIQTDRYLQFGTLEPLEPLRGTLSWNFGTTLLGTFFWNLHLALLLGTPEPLGTYTWNCGTSWILFLEPFAWNPYLEPRNLFEPWTLTWNFGTFQNLTFTWNPFWNPYSEPSKTFTWNPYWKLGTSWILCLEPFLETSEPSGTFTWNLGTFTWNPCLEPRNLAGWLPQSGLSLAETPKLSPVGEK